MLCDIANGQDTIILLQHDNDIAKQFLFTLHENWVSNLLRLIASLGMNKMIHFMIIISLVIINGCTNSNNQSFLVYRYMYEYIWIDSIVNVYRLDFLKYELDSFISNITLFFTIHSHFYSDILKIFSRPLQETENLFLSFWYATLNIHLGIYHRNQFHVNGLYLTRNFSSMPLFYFEALMQNIT